MKFLKLIVWLSTLFLCMAQCVAQETITSLTPFQLNSKHNIDSLIKMIGNKRIVAIGEDTHGTAEYYKFRDELTRRLIKEKGFNTFILENPHEDLMILHRDFQRLPLDTLIRRHLFSIYQTKEMKNFLVWLKTYTAKNKQFKIAGSDDSYREILPAELRKAIKPYKNARLNALALDYQQRQLFSIEEYYALPGKPKLGTLPDDLAFGYDTYMNLVLLDSVYGKQKKQSLAIKEMLFHAKSNYLIYTFFKHGKFLSRDEMMGMRVNYYAENKSAKIIVWAHNGHMSKSPLNQEIGLMGATVAKAYPGQYFAIGLATAEGQYSYMKNRFINDNHEFNDSLFVSTHLPADSASWNALFAEQESDSYLLNFSKLAAGEDSLFARKRPFKVLGYQKEKPVKKNLYFDVSLSALYDVLIFVRKTRATTPLFNPASLPE